MIARLLLLAALVLLAPGLARAQIVTNLVQYKNAWAPVEGNVAGRWRAAQSAYTAQVVKLPFSYLKAEGSVVNRVDWQVVWQTRSPSNYTGVGIFACPSLSSAETTPLDQACHFIAFFAGNDAGFAPYTPGCSGASPGPHPCGKNITAQWQQLLDEGNDLNLVLGTWGNGTSGPWVFDSELQIDWGLPRAPTARWSAHRRARR